MLLNVHRTAVEDEQINKLEYDVIKVQENDQKTQYSKIVFSKSFYSMCSLLQTRIWILFALDYTEKERKKERMCFPGAKQMTGMVFLSENQCEVLLSGLEKGEEVREGSY